MSRNRSTAQYVAVALGTTLVVAVISAGGVLAGEFGGLESPDQLATAMREGAVVRVADITGAPDLRGRGVFVQVTSTGLLCVFEAQSANSRGRQGGCNSADDPLGGAKLSASLSYDGGPAAPSVTDARLIGLVASDVASVQVLMSDGTRRTVVLNREAAVAIEAASYRAFGYRFDPAEFRRGIGPKAVVALDAAGEEIDRQATGFGG